MPTRASEILIGELRIEVETPGLKENALIFLTISNILVYLKKSSESVSEYEGFKNDKFYVPNSGFDIKLTNCLDFSVKFFLLIIELTHLLQLHYLYSFSSLLFLYTK